jgi:hypothetical protein
MIQIVTLLISFLWAQNAIVEPNHEDFRVVLDITRGVESGCVYQGDQEIRCFIATGGRNRAQTYTNAQGREVRYCSFTTTGENLKPQLVQYNRKSREFRTGLKYFVSFDEARGVGTHTGDVFGDDRYSGACIRLQEQDAKYLYDLVKENSVLRGQLVLSSRVTYTVVDNTPGRQQDECDCVTNYLSYMTIHKERAPQICNGVNYPVELPEYLQPKPTRPQARPTYAPERALRPLSRPHQFPPPSNDNAN